MTLTAFEIVLKFLFEIADLFDYTTSRVFLKNYSHVFFYAEIRLGSEVSCRVRALCTGARDGVKMEEH